MQREQKKSRKKRRKLRQKKLCREPEKTSKETIRAGPGVLLQPVGKRCSIFQVLPLKQVDRYGTDRGKKHSQ